MSPVFDENKYRALLESLEINEERLSQLDESLRIDSAFYTKDNEVKRVLNKPHTFFKDEIVKACKGIFDIKADSYSTSGIPFVRISNLRNMQIDTSDMVYIPAEIHQKNESSSLSYGDIVLSKTAIPAASIVSVPECNTSQDIIAMQLKKDASIHPFFTVVYLNTWYGLSFMEKLFTGNIQKHFNLSDCKEKLPIPVFSNSFQKQIGAFLEQSIVCNQKANETYLLAERILLQELGLTEWHPVDKSTTTKAFSVFHETGRLDAEHYQPKYDEFLSVINNYINGTTTIKEHFKQNKSQTSFSLSSYNYVEISDINVSSGEATFNLLPTKELPANAKYVIKRGDILISKVRPYRGAVSIIDFHPQNLIASGAFTILQENGEIQKEVLALLLRTPMYREWMLKWNVGSSYPVIKDEDILNLVIPKIPIGIQNKLSDNIQESFALRKKSKHLLALAKRSVETAIEQNEETAINLLEEEHNV